MTSNVRVAINQCDTLIWPQRCPCCGTKNNLAGVNSRVIRVNYLIPNYKTIFGSLRTENSIYQVDFPACSQHAFKNLLGIKLLEKSLMMMLIRAVIYICFFSIPILLMQIITGQKSFDQVWSSIPKDFMYSMLVGLIGMVLVVWAHRVSSVWPKAFDADRDVIIIRFQDELYARDFQRANQLATDPRYTRLPIWFLRPWIWKIVLALVFIKYMSHLMQNN